MHAAKNLIEDSTNIGLIHVFISSHKLFLFYVFIIVILRNHHDFNYRYIYDKIIIIVYACFLMIVIAANNQCQNLAAWFANYIIFAMFCFVVGL